MVSVYGDGAAVCAGCGRVMRVADLKDGRCPNCVPAVSAPAPAPEKAPEKAAEKED